MEKKPVKTLIITEIVKYLRETPAAASPIAWWMVIARLSEAYGDELIDRAMRQYGRELRQEQQHHTG
jgi:hypothetical protein